MRTNQIPGLYIINEVADMENGSSLHCSSIKQSGVSLGKEMSLQMSAEKESTFHLSTMKQSSAEFANSTVLPSASRFGALEDSLKKEILRREETESKNEGLIELVKLNNRYNKIRSGFKVQNDMRSQSEPAEVREEKETLELQLNNMVRYNNELVLNITQLSEENQRLKRASKSAEDMIRSALNTVDSVKQKEERIDALFQENEYLRQKFFAFEKSSKEEFIAVL